MLKRKLDQMQRLLQRKADDSTWGPNYPEDVVTRTPSPKRAKCIGQSSTTSSGTPCPKPNDVPVQKIALTKADLRRGGVGQHKECF